MRTTDHLAPGFDTLAPFPLLLYSVSRSPQAGALLAIAGVHLPRLEARGTHHAPFCLANGKTVEGKQRRMRAIMPDVLLPTQACIYHVRGHQIRLCWRIQGRFTLVARKLYSGGGHQLLEECALQGAGRAHVVHA